MSASPSDPNAFLTSSTVASEWKKIIIYFASSGKLESIRQSLTSLIEARKTKFLLAVFQPDAELKQSLLFSLLLRRIAAEGLIQKNWQESCIQTLSFFKDFPDERIDLILSTLTREEQQQLVSVLPTVLSGNCHAISGFLLVNLIQHLPNYRSGNFSWYQTLSACDPESNIFNYLELLSSRSKKKLALEILINHTDLSKQETSQLLDTLDTEMILHTLITFTEQKKDAADLCGLIMARQNTPADLIRICKLSVIEKQLYQRQTEKYQTDLDNKMYNAKRQFCSEIRQKIRDFILAHKEDQPDQAVRTAAKSILSYLDALPRKKHGELITEGVPTAFINKRIHEIRKLLLPLAQPPAVSQVSITSNRPSDSAQGEITQTTGVYQGTGVSS